MGRLRITMASVLLCGALCLCACSTSSHPEAQPVPDLSFAHIQPIFLPVSAIALENNVATDWAEASNVTPFPTPPDVALYRYATQKLRAGQEGNAARFHFVIEEAQVSQTHQEPEGQAWWALLREGDAGKDIYRVAMKIRLYLTTETGEQSAHEILTIQQDLILPSHLSVAAREWEQFAFLEQMMKHVDVIVTQTLRDKMGVVS